MLTRAITVGGIVTAALLAAPAVARADGWGEVGCGQAPTPHCELTAGSSGAPQTGSSDPDGASHEADSDHDGKPTCGYSTTEGSASGGWQPPGSWYEGTCSLTGVISNPGLLPAPVDVARLARARLDLPKPALAANPAGTQLVNLPTWLWLTRGWETVTATASVPGVAVTATARPSSLTWAMGDGAIVTCSGPGIPFRIDADPRSSSPDCGTYAVTVTVHWSVTWAGAGESGTFPEMTTTSSTSFHVAESQALNTAPGPR
jgi:hypothetical protein